MNRNSALLRLPTEIRQEIWKYVLGGKTYQASCFSGRYYSESYRFAPSAAEPRNGMALLRICRQIYSEAVFYPFFKATFAYHNLTYLKRSIKFLRPYQLNNITHLRVDCRRRNQSYYFEDSGLLSDNKLNFTKMFPALIHVTAVAHGITDTEIGFDGEPYVAKVENIPQRLRKIIEDAGASLEVTSTHDKIVSRNVDEMDDADEKDKDGDEEELDGMDQVDGMHEMDVQEVDDMSAVNEANEAHEVEEVNGMVSINELLAMDVAWDPTIPMDWD